MNIEDRAKALFDKLVVVDALVGYGIVPGHFVQNIVAGEREVVAHLISLGLLKFERTGEETGNLGFTDFGYALARIRSGQVEYTEA